MLNSDLNIYLVHLNIVLDSLFGGLDAFHWAWDTSEGASDSLSDDLNAFHRAWDTSENALLRT